MGMVLVLRMRMDSMTVRAMIMWAVTVCSGVSMRVVTVWGVTVWGVTVRVVRVWVVRVRVVRVRFVLCFGIVFALLLQSGLDLVSCFLEAIVHFLTEFDDRKIDFDIIECFLEGVVPVHP